MTATSTSSVPDWREMRVDQIGAVVSGATPSTSKTEYWDGPIAWVTPVDLSTLNTRHLTTSERTLTELGLSRCAARLIPARNLVISARGSVGHMALPIMPFSTNQSCFTLQFYIGQNPDFHYYNLKFWNRRIEDKCEGTTFDSISRSALTLVEVPVPRDIEVQARIADVLATVDQAIEQTEALLAKQQRIKTGLMHDLLTRGLDTQGRLRNPSTHPFKPSRYGLIPEEWDVSPASALCDAVIDCKNRTPPSAPSGHPVIRTPNVRNGRFVYEDLALTDNESYEVWISRGKPGVGDVVITREAPYGEACQIPADIPAACLGQRMMMYQPNPMKLRGDYLVYAIYSRAVQSRLLELAGGSTVGHIRVGDVRSLPIPHPRSTNEQGDICVALNSLSSIDTETVSSLRKLTKLKAGLMHDLLTGRVPVTPLLPNSRTLISL